MKSRFRGLSKISTFLLILLLIGNTIVPTVSAQKPISSVKVEISGDRVMHAFGDKRYASDYYKNIKLNVVATYSDGTSSNVTNESIFTNTDAAFKVTNGTLIAQNDSIGDVIVTYQNQQAVIKVQSIWDYVAGSYDLKLVSSPKYGEIAQSNVLFKDSNLERVIREALNKPVGTITEVEMKKLTSIDASYQNIKDLTGLQFAINLEDLNAEGNEISDLTPLSGISKLKKLWLGLNQITNLQPLSNLNQLTELYVWENHLTSLKGLEKLKNLSILDVHNNTITDINDINQLINLVELNVSVNGISNILPLANLLSLNHVQLSRNAITDVQVLRNLNSLDWVDVTRNPLNTETFNILGELQARGVSVDYFSYDNTPIIFDDLKLEQAISNALNLPTPIKKGDLQQVEYLDFTNKGITSLKGLEYATSLQKILLSFNPLTNINPLKNLSQLDWVEISRVPLDSNSMETVQLLKNNGAYVDYDANFDFEVVQFADQNLEDAISEELRVPKPLTKGDLEKADYLFLRNDIKNLKGLEYATNLIGLYMDGNLITSIDELKGLNQLRDVSLTRNPLSLEALATINELRAKGMTVEYDQYFDPTPIDFQDPLLEYRLGELLNVPSPLLKGDLSQVESLNLNGQDQLRAITRLEGLENASKVKTLLLNDNLISDLSPLANMGQLRELQVKNNDIKDLTPLLELTNLRYLDIRNNLLDASPNSPARGIISTLQARGVTVLFNESSDAIVKGTVSNRVLGLYSYFWIQGNGKSFYTPWNNEGKSSFKLDDGIYTVAAVTMYNRWSANLTFHPFEIKGGKIYVNGEVKESLDVSINDFTASPAPLPEHITITKNLSSNDTVVVTGLNAGDIISVYNEADMTLLGLGTVEDGQTSVTISIPNLGSPGQKVSVTREMIEIYESAGTLVVIPDAVEEPPVVTEPTDPEPPVVTPPNDPAPAPGNPAPAPTVYTITAAAGANGTISPNGSVSVADGTNQTFTITPEKGYEIATLQVDGVDESVTNTRYTFTNVKSNHTISVTFKAVKDVTPPTAPMVNEVSDNSGKVTGKAEAGSIVTVSLGSKKIGEGTADKNGNFTVTISKQKASTVLKVVATDRAKNTSKPTSITVIDKTPPAKPVVNTVSSTSIKVTGKAEASSTVTVFVGSKAIGKGTVDKNGNFTVMISKQKARTVLKIVATDRAKNTSQPTSITVIDKTPPSKPIVNTVTSTSINVTGKAEAGSTVMVKVGSKVIGTATAGKDGKFSVKIPKQKVKVVLTVIAKDKSGYESIAVKVTVKK